MINQQPTLSVDKMKMTKFGFRMDLFNFSSVLSVIGIFVSIVGVIGGIALFFVASSVDLAYTGLSKLFYAAGAVTLILIIPFLAMWILLKIKTKNQDIPGIEKIGKVYTYVSGCLEIIGMIVFIGLVAIVSILDRSGSGHGNSFTNIILGFMIGLVIGAAFYLIFACLKIHGTRVEKNKLLGAYIGFRYVLFILYMTGLAILILYLTSQGQGLNIMNVTITFIGGFVHFFLDVGPTVILHSIRVDRENAARTENNIIHCSQLKN